MTIDMRYDPTRGHWCDFCQTFHSSQSCYHPGGNMLREAQNRIAELTLGIKSLTERCGDLEGDLERMLAQKIGEQKAKAKAEREVERLRKENRDLMLDWQKRQDKYEEELAKVRGSGAELVHALKRIASLESALERYREKNAELIDNGISLSEQLHDAVLERDELKLKNDVATSNIKLYCDEIRQLKAKLAQAEAEVERLTPHQNCGSHWDGCWRAGGHHSCAIAEVERLKLMLEAAYEYGGFGGLYAAEYDDWLADLARRCEEHRADH